MRKRMEKFIARLAQSKIHGGLLIVSLIATIGVKFINLKLPKIAESSIFGLCYLLLISWLIWTGWHNLGYRYVALISAKVYCRMARFLRNSLGDIILIFLLIRLILSFFFSISIEIIRPLSFELAFKILIFLFVVEIFHLAIRSRKRVHIIQFINLTGDDKLKFPTEGIHVRLINRLINLIELVQEKDLINPDKSEFSSDYEKIGCFKLNADDTGDMLKGLLPPDQKIKIASFIEIPAGFLMSALSRLMRGPILSGSLHKKGDALELVAQVHGGKLNKSWCIAGDDLDDISPGLSQTEILEQMIGRLVYKVFTYLGPVRRQSWKAIMYYTEGLKTYRECQNKTKEKNIYLRRSEKSFISAINEDNSFIKCLYHLGVVYEELGQLESAESAYREALQYDPTDADSHFLLGCYYCEMKKFEDALFHCNESLRYQTNDARFWNLKGVIYDRLSKGLNASKERVQQKKKRHPDIPYRYENPNIFFSIAVKLSWLDLLKLIIREENNKRLRRIAHICELNLALVNAEDQVLRKSCLFHLSYLASSGEGKPFFKLGVFYCRKEKWEKSIAAFLKVFENDYNSINNILFWGLYLYVCGKLNDIEKNEYQMKLPHAINHLLDAISEKLWGYMKSNCIDINRTLEDFDLNRNNYSDIIVKDKDLIKSLTDNISIMLRESLEDEFEKEYSTKNEKHFVDKVIKQISMWIGLRNNCEQETNDSFRNIISGKIKEWYMAQLLIFIAKKYLYCIEGSNDEKDQPKETIRKIIEIIKAAVEKLSSDYKREIGTHDLYRLMAECYILKKEYREALFYSQKALEFNPQSAQNRIILSRVYFILQDYESGIKELEKCLFLGHDEPEILHYLPLINKAGAIYRAPLVRRKAFGLILQLLEKFLEKMNSIVLDDNKKGRNNYFGELERIHYHIGIYNRELKEYDKAYASFRTAASLSNRKGSWKAKIELGRTYLEARDYNKAEQIFREIYDDIEGYGIRKDSHQEIELYLGLASSIIERTVFFEKTKSNNKKQLNDSTNKRTVLSNNPQDVFKEPQELLNYIDKLLHGEIKGKAKSKQDAKVKAKKNYGWYSALLQECYGRIEFKQGNTALAISHLEISLSYRGSARVYYFFAEAYWMLAQEKNKSKRYLYLEKALEACRKSQDLDINEKYNIEVEELKKKITLALDSIYSENGKKSKTGEKKETK